MEQMTWGEDGLWMLKLFAVGCVVWSRTVYPCVTLHFVNHCAHLRPHYWKAIWSVRKDRRNTYFIPSWLEKISIGIYIYMDRCGHLHFVFLLVWLVLWWELLVQRQRDVCSPTWLPDPMRSAELRFSWTLTGNGWEWMGMELLIEVHIHSFFKNQIGLYILGLGKFGFTKWLGFCIHFLLHSMALSWYLQNE